MKYIAASSLFALIGIVALPGLVLSQMDTPGIGPNGETLAVCGMPVIGALLAAPIGMLGGAILGLLIAYSLPTPNAASPTTNT